MFEVVLKKGREKSLLKRHPWVYESAVARVSGEPRPGDLVRVTAHDSRFLAWASWSPSSAIRARCWSFRADDVIDERWFEQKLRAAVGARADLASRTTAVRLVFGEADQLPGLIVDRYGDYLVCEILSAGMESRRGKLAEMLMGITGSRGVYERSDSAVRLREGLPKRAGLLCGEEPPREITVTEDGVEYGVDVRIGHKTGFYIDQRENRLLAQRLAKNFREKNGRGLRALNCFCYTGGFSLALMKGGAESVTSVDSSGEALALARENAERNGFDGQSLSWVEADVFDFLRRERESGRRYDLIVLDPPKFASSHYHVERAARAYKDISLNGLKLLSPGGHLLTFSCSGAISRELFQKIIAGAVQDAGVDAWLAGWLGAGADHPLLMTYPEGEYLKGLHLKLV
ncbi:class I SAM-dependent rRNA methyltransferase [Mesosutterella sp. AGMB02718]|uniref:Class I SAM-dependent rRNA methyltransferase n=1 Tax=Mesosutterella faecium TaxID=2925194 RepID=A0ABT7ILU4_9BURK|nr:class I SAM-dependent rRNA methyltransferase [Mesosutterella sp. AGMB02718]MDL2058893.1 class I SAM-dependent rRNA methyltransferase [Mesosutterella sp. AGMB02718]